MAENKVQRARGMGQGPTPSCGRPVALVSGAVGMVLKSHWSVAKGMDVH